MTRRAAALSLLAALGAGACHTHRAPNASVPEPPPASATAEAEKLPPEKTQTWATPKPESEAPPPPPKPAPLAAFVVLTSRDDSVRIDPLLERLVNALHATEAFTIANRARLADILGAEDPGEGGRVSDATRAKIGQVTGAKYLVVATAGPNQDAADPNPREMILNMSAIDSGVVAASARTTGRDLEEASDKAARSLAEEVRARLRDGTLAGPGPR